MGGGVRVCCVLCGVGVAVHTHTLSLYAYRPKGGHC